MPEQTEQKTPAEVIADMQKEIVELKESHARDIAERDAVIAQLTRKPAETEPAHADTPDPVKIAERLNKRR